jgi:hypothetical protein
MSSRCSRLTCVPKVTPNAHGARIACKRGAAGYSLACAVFADMSAVVIAHPIATQQRIFMRRTIPSLRATTHLKDGDGATWMR